MLSIFLGIVIWLIIVGVLLFLVDRAPFIALEAKGWIRWVIVAFTAIAFIYWLLGAISHLPGVNIRLPW